MTKKLSQLNNEGFGLIEVLIAAVVIGISFVGFSTFILFSRDQTLKAQRETEAVALAEEALEVVRKMRDDSWSNISGKIVGTTYYPKITGSTWILDTTPPSPSGYYTTRIVFSNVTRDASFNIASVGINDPETKKVEASVTWNDSGTKSLSLTTYITNFRNN
jgi:prepilin-type N-terminal cleavage/methylation domain-containing protein